MEGKLTRKQRRFVEEYCADFNGTQAAVRAGYSRRTARSIGSENLAKPDVAAAILERLDELSMSAAEATKRLTDWGRGTVEPFLTADVGGGITIDLSSDDAQANLHLIRKVKQTERILLGDGDDGTRVLERRMEIELHDAKDAVVQIARIRGVLRDRVENIDVDLSLFNQEGLERIARGESPISVLISGGHRVLAAQLTTEGTG